MSSTEIPILEVDRLLAATPTWHIDPWHTAVHFSTLNRGAGRVRGHFTRASGTVQPGSEGLSDVAVRVSIDTASFTTGVSARDRQVRSQAFLDTEQHPAATFTATGFSRTGTGHGRLDGQLQIRGVTQEVSLAVRWQGSAADPFRDGSTHLAFTATGEITLSQFGMRQDLIPGLRIPGIGDAVELVLDVVLIGYDPAPMLANIPID